MFFDAKVESRVFSCQAFIAFLVHDIIDFIGLFALSDQQEILNRN